MLESLYFTQLTVVPVLTPNIKHSHHIKIESGPKTRFKHDKIEATPRICVHSSSLLNQNAVLSNKLSPNSASDHELEL